MLRTAILGLCMGLIAAPAIACPDDQIQMALYQAVQERSNRVTLRTPVPVGETPFTHEDGTPGYATDYRGVPTIITVWNPRCPGCRIEMPALNEIAAEYDNNPNINFVQVTANIPEHFGRDYDVAGVDDYLDRMNYDAIDRHTDEAGAIFHDNCLVATPSHLFLDSSGRITRFLQGPQDWTGVEHRAVIEQMIAGG